MYLKKKKPASCHGLLLPVGEVQLNGNGEVQLNGNKYCSSSNRPSYYISGNSCLVIKLIESKFTSFRPSY